MGIERIPYGVMKCNVEGWKDLRRSGMRWHEIRASF
jgi:hypothetical protein